MPGTSPQSPIMNKITLIVPPSPFLLNDKVFVSLGILYVAAALEQAGHEVQVQDLTGGREWKNRVREIAREGDWPVGLTSTSADFPLVLEMLAILRAEAPRRMIIIGGPHATIAPDDCRDFDRVVIGDGVAGIHLALSGGQKMVHAPMIKDLDSLPRPARHLVNMDDFHYEISGRRATNVMSQFGCPFGCIFCCGRNIAEYRSVRSRSPRDFIGELDELNRQYGFRAFMIHDDEFNLNRKRLLEMCDHLSRRDYLFRAFVRSDLFSDEIAEAMAGAGFYQVDSGVESGSERILKLLNKGTTPRKNAEARRLARKHGIRYKAFVTIGHPSETREDIMATKRWLLENEPDDFEIYLICPYPGSQIYDNLERYDLDFDIDYRKDVTSITRRFGEHRSFINNSHLSGAEFSLLREEVDLEVRQALGLPLRSNDENRTAGI